MGRLFDSFKKGWNEAGERFPCLENAPDCFFWPGVFFILVVILLALWL